MANLVEYDNFHAPVIGEGERRCTYRKSDGDYCGLLGDEHEVTPDIAYDVIVGLTRHPVEQVWRAAQDLGNALSIWEDEDEVLEPLTEEQKAALLTGIREEFVDSNRSDFAAYVRSYYPERARELLPSGDWGALEG